MVAANRYLQLLGRREVLLSLLVIGFVGAGMGAASWAYLQDTDQSTDNAVQASTLDLKVDGGDASSGAFSITDGKPGSTTTHEFVLENDGSVAADHVEFAVSVSENDSASEPSDPDLDRELNAAETASLIRVTTLEYQNDTGGTVSNELDGLADENGNGIIDLEDVQSQSGSFDDLPAPQANTGNTTRLVVEVAIANDDGAAFDAGANTAGNLTGYDEDIMADGVDVTVTVTINQDGTQ